MIPSGCGLPRGKDKKGQKMTLSFTGNSALRGRPSSLLRPPNWRWHHQLLGA